MDKATEVNEDTEDTEDTEVNKDTKDTVANEDEYTEVNESSQKTIDDLIADLKRIEVIDIPLQDETNVFFGNLDADTQVSDACCLAEDLLITNSGKCNWENINHLRTNGFDVTAGEEDRFGWLTGCIHTSKGIIVYS